MLRACSSQLSGGLQHLFSLSLDLQRVLAHLRPLFCTSQDLLHFAYQPYVGLDDAVICLLQKAHSALDRPNTTVHITFFDFSCAFYTILPKLLKVKLEVKLEDFPLTAWITA